MASKTSRTISAAAALGLVANPAVDLGNAAQKAFDEFFIGGKAKVERQFGQNYGVNAAYAQEPNAGHASPSTNIRDYKGEFRKLGWDVYDTGTDDISKITPKEKLQYRITGEQFKKAYEANSNGVRGYFSTEEQKTIQALIDGSTVNDKLGTVNDKLGFVFVTPENRISITIFSQDKKIGENGLYVLRKGIGPLEAEGIRKISPDYRKH